MNKVNKMVLAVILGLMITSPITVMAEDKKDEVTKTDNGGHGTEQSPSADTDFYLIDEHYSTIEEWDEKGLPKVNGKELTQGWFKHKEKFHKIEDSEITVREAHRPSNFDAKNGLGSVEFNFHFEEGFNEPIGIMITSYDEGVEGIVQMSEFSGYKAIFRDLPAGNYHIPIIFDGRDNLMLPLTKEIDYEYEFTIKKDMTQVIDIFSKEYYEQEGIDGRKDKMEQEKADKEEQEQNQVDEEIVVEEVVKVKKSNLGLKLIVITLLSALGFAAYKAYLHVK